MLHQHLQLCVLHILHGSNVDAPVGIICGLGSGVRFPLQGGYSGDAAKI